MNKMNKIIMLFLAVGVSSLSAIKKSDHVVTFFVENYPEVHPTQAIQPSMFAPGKIYKNMAQSMIKDLGTIGVFATYGGFLAHTNQNGQIIFPRKTQKPNFDLFITNEIQPYLMAGTTNVRYWTIDNDAQAARFKVQRQEDPKTGLYYWQVTKGVVPKTKIIPLHSIVVFAKPKNIYIPQGITLTNDNSQFILPTIYAKPQLDDVKNALFVMNLKIFFQPLHPKFKQDKLAISQMMQP
ncbi:hypothetical protein HOM50_00375 [bacterium]|nr:hypothetical protein [bacterium]MBT5014849.1 hypothetical protein [bacterium]